MRSFIVTISHPKYLTPDEEIILGAKGVFDLMRIIMKYSKRYYEINIKVR